MSNSVQKRQTPYICADLAKKMIWLTGPRQCGKTTLAESLLKESGGRYYTWDVLSDRRTLQAQAFDEKAKLWVFDELHSRP